MTKSSIKKGSLILLAIILCLTLYYYLDINQNLKVKEKFCYEKLTKKLEEGTPPDQIFQEDLMELQELVEYSLVARSGMLELFNRLRVDQDSPIHSNDLMTLKEGTEFYMGIRNDLYKMANAYECGIDVYDETLEKFNIPKELRLKGIMLSLGAALTLYDNYLLGSVLFEQDERLRQIINDPDMGFGVMANKLNEMTLAANSIEKRHRVRRVLKFYEEEKARLNIDENDYDYAYLESLIELSPSYNYVKKIRIKEIAANKFIAFERITTDMIDKTQDEGFDMLSGLFGNTLGMYESRKGKLFGDEEALKNIQDHLQPLDILLEKTPFRLTDKMIPGHFGHVAIWTGTKAELIDMELWNHLMVEDHHEEVGNENDPNSKDEDQIIEALRSGVQLNSLEEFMNIDDFAILRPIFPEEVSEERKKEALLMAFRQLGKKYDFNFDVNTTDKIVCSELAYISFPSIDWPTEETLGRHNISPDNVAKLAWNNLPLELILFYHDGEMVEKDIMVDKMIELMTEE